MLRLILANPLARLKMARERRTRRQVLSVEEEQKLLTAASPHLKPIITAALDTGMRRGEITGQLWEHIDFPRKLLFVTKSKTPEGESREIPLSARLLDWLAEHQQPSGPVFGYRG
ncbi:MAG: tyrosine-type recombinase/integrase [Bryobacterales bacterium]|nr:tyrosine-type recombinase/integrase [Bryobacterales bacterium]